MVAASLLLVVIYLGVRIQFSKSISITNAKQDILFTGGATLALICSSIGNLILPDSISLWVGLVVVATILLQMPQIMRITSKTATILIVSVLIILVCIPYVQLLAFILVSFYFIYLALKTTKRLTLIAGAFVAMLAPLAVFFFKIEIVYYGMALYLTTLHFAHTMQLLEMMKNAGKNVVTDQLTGLYNRRWLFAKANQLGAQKEIGIIFCDIDNFKIINDTKGHEFGDVVLKKAGEILKRETVGFGFPARYGGEELVALITSPENSLKVAERILNCIQKEVNVTMSIGVARGSGNVEEVIKLADERMYISKNSGKNRVTHES